jgi:hypothetical protein
VIAVVDGDGLRIAPANGVTRAADPVVTLRGASRLDAAGWSSSSD